MIANYGVKKTYVVRDIKFDMGPCHTFFTMKDKTKVSVAKYFYKTYNLKITEKDQPMLLMSQQGKPIYVPPEFCIMDGVPESIRKNGKDMRILLGKTRQDPNQKIKSIVDMINKLFSSNKCKQYGITIDQDPLQLESRKLAAPELIHNEGDKSIHASDRVLKQMPIFNYEPMAEKKLILIYENYMQREAENTYNNLMNCQGALKVKTGQIERLLLKKAPGADKFRNFKDQIHQFIESLKRRGGSQDNMDYFAIFLLDWKDDYDKVKRILTELDLLSQIVTKQTSKKINLSVASNVIKQINSKLGGESIRIKMPEVIEKEFVMSIGIDVCHAGGNSIVGFCASTDKFFNNYYNDFIIQPKFQELVKTELDRCLKNAVMAFKDANNGQMPTKIVIYRDGVGEQMRDQIVAKEITQFKNALKQIYTKGQIPPITLVVVNKRINQRVFVEGGHDQFANPPPGSIIDSNLVENEENNSCFDFFLVPQQTTQGCVTPTHFFVSLNESADLSKEDIENFTYNLCYMYSNWSGSIKVPAPCQNSHKIAEYHNIFDTKGMIKRTCKIDSKMLNYNTNFSVFNYHL